MSEQEHVYQEVTVDQGELEDRYCNIQGQLMKIKIAMRNSALGAACGHQDARDQYMMLRGRMQTLETEIEIIALAIAEMEEMAARKRAGKLDPFTRSEGRSA
jgi:hypothetical protein